MFTDPLSVTVDTIGAQALSRINQDSYGSEYLLQAADGLSELRMKIRHSKETVKVGANPVDRHNVELTQYVYPTASIPQGRTRQAYLVFRNEPGDSLVLANDLMEALMVWTTEANIVKLLAWES
ncbi:MAG: putative coat protein [Frobavirus nemorishabitans]|uniref:Coat protein n=1 Tax=Leviviridae sp. TaxID=2027243 RepID=A0ABY3SUF2_9VIRU|nr:MAG: putative coat protein [Leviviridae sp.]